MAEVTDFVEALTARQISILNSKGATPESIDELSEYALCLFRRAVSEGKQPDKIRAEILRRLAHDASLECILNGKARLSLFFATLPILFDNGRDPDIKPTVPSEPYNPWSSDPSAT